MSSTKVGIGILFNNNFELQIMRSYIDPPGRFIICDLMANGKLITLVNVYAPNEDDPDFLKLLLNTLKTFKRTK